jgi:tetratricopeptide (TPR) repeat protein
MVSFGNRCLLIWLLSLGICCLVPSLTAAQSKNAPLDPAQQGELLLSQGRWDEAIKALSLAVQREPNQAATRANLGMAYYFKGDSKTAAPEFQAALRIDQDRIDAMHGLGLALYDQGDLAGAIAAFQTSSRQNPTAYYV